MSPAEPPLGRSPYLTRPKRPEERLRPFKRREFHMQDQAATLDCLQGPVMSPTQARNLGMTK